MVVLVDKSEGLPLVFDRETAAEKLDSLIGMTVTLGVAAHLRGMRQTLTARKATQCLEETQTLTELSI